MCFLLVLEVSSSSYFGRASTRLAFDLLVEVLAIMIAKLPGVKLADVCPSRELALRNWPVWANRSPTTPRRMKCERKNLVMNFLNKARTYAITNLLSNNLNKTAIYKLTTKNFAVGSKSRLNFELPSQIFPSQTPSLRGCAGVEESAWSQAVSCLGGQPDDVEGLGV